jgi:hypothetical protein
MNLTPTLDPHAEMAQPKYATAHLEFRRDTIEPLPDDLAFEVDTPAGTFRMTKRDFHATFPEIVSSVSYRDLGLYHYPMIPYKAFRFLVRESKASVDQQLDGSAKEGLEERIDQEPGQ